ncbi:MAG: phosphotransferase [Pseudomonadota bacterium]
MERLAPVIALWGLPPDADIALINISENRTYKISSNDMPPVILRQHRRDYHSKAAIESEMAWLGALQSEAVIAVPKSIAGLDGQLIQEYADTYFVMFEFIAGKMPDETSNLEAKFNLLGKIAAKTHLHSLGWQRPKGFTRQSWTLETVFGPAPIWGRWQDAPNVTSEIRRVLDQTEREIIKRLGAYGQGADRFGLIHADMRLANLLIEGVSIRLIDFDDCGFGWFMYDFAAAISFIEISEKIPDLLKAWLSGYQLVRPLSDADIGIISTLVMLRRMNLLAWIGSHMEATEPQELAPNFAVDTAGLAGRYLDGSLL